MVVLLITMCTIAALELPPTEAYIMAFLDSFPKVIFQALSRVTAPQAFGVVLFHFVAYQIGRSYIQRKEAIESVDRVREALKVLRGDLENNLRFHTLHSHIRSFFDLQSVGEVRVNERRWHIHEIFTKRNNFDLVSSKLLFFSPYENKSLNKVIDMMSVSGRDESYFVNIQWASLVAMPIFLNRLKVSKKIVCNHIESNGLVIKIDGEEDLIELLSILSATEEIPELIIEDIKNLFFWFQTRKEFLKSNENVLEACEREERISRDVTQTLSELMEKDVNNNAWKAELKEFKEFFVKYLTDVGLMLREMRQQINGKKELLEKMTLALKATAPLLLSGSDRENMQSYEAEHFSKISPQEAVLAQSVQRGQSSQVVSLLARRVSPNIQDFYGHSLLTFAVSRYLSCPESNAGQKAEWFAICKALLQYGANYATPQANGVLALVAASDSGCVELCDLILQHSTQVPFRSCSVEDLKEYPQEFRARYEPVVNVVSNHHRRIERLFAVPKLVSLASSGTVRVLKTSNERALVKTEIIRENDIVNIETMLAFKLTSGEISALSERYVNTFGSTSTISNSEKAHHFREKLGLCGKEREVYVDLLKIGKNISGCNLFEIHSGAFNNKPYFVVYGSLIFVENSPQYRGLRVMTLLMFRVAHALKITNPDVEVYMFYDAISEFSFRLVLGLPFYPLIRTEGSLAFVKQILMQIYGPGKAKEFNGVENYFFPTDSRVMEKSNPDNYDLPFILNLFKELTQGKGGVPILLPVVAESFSFFDEKIKFTSFTPHVKEFSYAFFNEAGADQVRSSAQLLWPEADEQILRGASKCLSN